MKLLLQRQGYIIRKSAIGPGQKLGTSSHLFCGLYVLLVPLCSLWRSYHLVCFPNRLNCIPHKYIFSLCFELAPVFQSGSLSLLSEQLPGCWLCTWITWAGNCACAGSNGRGDRTTQLSNSTHSLFSDPACISHLFKKQFGHFKFQQLYSGTDCSDFPAFVVNGCSAAHKVMAKGSQAAFCV